MGAVSIRLSRSLPSLACILMVNGRSLLACSPMAGRAVTGVPLWRSTTFLMFCAQMVGKPVTAAVVAAAVADFRIVRREIPREFWLVERGTWASICQ